MNRCIEIPLDGTADQLAALFSYSTAELDSNLTTLESYIAHGFNLTLVRERFHGAWAQVIQNDQKVFVLKMYSPHHDLSPYADLVPAYMEAGKIALSIFQESVQPVISQGTDQMRFLLPFGLSMAKTKSVQLLHFPPLETFVYQDYLYSPTNRRWENLLGYNSLFDANFSELETIVDCVPIAAGGDDSKGIFPFNNLFTPYVKKMLQARLHPSGNTTQPVVAYGEPVMLWLEQNFTEEVNAQIPDGKLQPLSLIELKLFDNDIKTPVLCANHPSKYLYDTDDNDPTHFDSKKEIMTQDLIAAGWQARMANHFQDAPHAVLQELKDHWTNNPRVLEIIEQEDQSYGYKL